MPVDFKYLREHYASLSDDALRAINRADLVEAARTCYDDEISRRNLASRRGVRDAYIWKPMDEDAGIDGEALDDGGKPEWLKDGAEVLSRADFPGAAPAADIANARDVLEAAGIPCYLDLCEIPEEQSASSPPTHLWRLMVPGNLNLRATSVLDRDIFNQEFEAEWKTLLETLSDEELRGMNPRLAFCGLFDRVERVTRSYEEEIARRRI